MSLLSQPQEERILMDFLCQLQIRGHSKASLISMSFIFNGCDLLKLLNQRHHMRMEQFLPPNSQQLPNPLPVLISVFLLSLKLFLNRKGLGVMWDSGRFMIPWQGWSWMRFKIPPKPNLSMIPHRHSRSSRNAKISNLGQ